MAAKRKRRNTKTRTVTRYVTRAPQRRKRRTSGVKNVARDFGTDAKMFIPLFILRYLTTKAYTVQWFPYPDILLPLLAWYVSTKTTVMPGMREVAAVQVGNALYDRFIEPALTTTSGVGNTKALTTREVDKLAERMNLRQTAGAVPSGGTSERFSVGGAMPSGGQDFAVSDYKIE